MGRYVEFDQIEIRLNGKVRITEDESKIDLMQKKLALRLISEGESQVELDLSPRYAVPFEGADDSPFKKLPPFTRDTVVNLCELMACIRILETDFGTGSAVDGSKYARALRIRYREVCEQLMRRNPGDTKDDSARGFFYPPLPSLKLSWMNTQADDGFRGTILVASGSESQGVAANQINHPTEGFFGKSAKWPW